MERERESTIVYLRVRDREAKKKRKNESLKKCLVYRCFSISYSHNIIHFFGKLLLLLLHSTLHLYKHSNN